MATLTDKICKVIDGQHYMGADGLASYHAAQAVKRALRRRGIGPQLAGVKLALNSFRVTARIDVDESGEFCILIYRSDCTDVSARL